MSEFFQTFDQRVVARNDFCTPIGVNMVRTAIPDVCNGGLLTEYQSCCQSGAAAWRFILNGPLRIFDGSLHHLLQGFIRLGLVHSKQVRVKLFHNVAGYYANGGIAGNLPVLMSTHAIRDDVQTKW